MTMAARIAASGACCARSALPSLPAKRLPDEFRRCLSRPRQLEGEARTRHRSPVRRPHGPGHGDRERAVEEAEGPAFTEAAVIALDTYGEVPAWGTSMIFCCR